MPPDYPGKDHLRIRNPGNYLILSLSESSTFPKAAAPFLDAVTDTLEDDSVLSPPFRLSVPDGAPLSLMINNAVSFLAMMP